MADQLSFDSRILGEQALAKMAEIEALNSPERRAYASRSDLARADARIAELQTDVSRLTKLADVAARTEHNELLAAQQARENTDTSAAEDADDDADGA